MSEAIKDQRKALKTTITNAISAALSKNKHLKDKKVQKAIKKAASEVAKKIAKADVIKSPIPVKRATTAVKKVVKKVAASKKTPAKSLVK
jgi:hypothetical protein